MFSPRSNLAALLIARALSYFARPLDYPERECYQSSARVAAPAIFAARDPTIFQKIASPSQAKNRSCIRGFMFNTHRQSE